MARTRRLLLSSDLPLVDADGLRRMLAHSDGDGRDGGGRARRGAGRAPTRCTCVHPATSTCTSATRRCRASRQEAHRRGRSFVIHDDPSLALDLDEPSDLSAWRVLEPTA